MRIRMYDCSFGDCFRFMEEEKVDLCVDFGILGKSMSPENKKSRYQAIINDMPDDIDFLLTHYHEDHYSGVLYMAKKTNKRFRNVYLSDIWGEDSSIKIVSNILLNGIYSNYVIAGSSLIDFLRLICKTNSRIYFLSRGTKFCDNQYVVLWPDKSYLVKKAETLETEIRQGVDSLCLEKIEAIASQLNSLVLDMSREGYNQGKIQEDLEKLNEDYKNVGQKLLATPASIGVRRKLNNFGNNISVVFQNCEDVQRNILFTGDFGGKRNWKKIIQNNDHVVAMHSNYHVIKVPHHGTDAYYYPLDTFLAKNSVALIPNGGTRYKVSEKYRQDFLNAMNKSICSRAICNKKICPNGTRIHCDLFMDI